MDFREIGTKTINNKVTVKVPAYPSSFESNYFAKYYLWSFFCKFCIFLHILAEEEGVVAHNAVLLFKRKIFVFTPLLVPNLD